jgi:hypothetical protein
VPAMGPFYGPERAVTPFFSQSDQVRMRSARSYSHAALRLCRAAPVRGSAASGSARPFAGRLSSHSAQGSIAPICSSPAAAHGSRSSSALISCSSAASTACRVLLPVADRPAEDDEAIINEPVHECRVLILAILVPDLARGIPACPVNESYRVVSHDRSVLTATDIDWTASYSTSATRPNRFPPDSASASRRDLANCKEVGTLAFPEKRLVRCFTKRFRGSARRNCVRRPRVLSCRDESAPCLVARSLIDAGVATPGCRAPGLAAGPRSPGLRGGTMTG